MYLTQGLRRAAQIRPQEQSTAFRERRRIWSETVDRIARIAGGLAQAGVQPGDRVAILALNSDRYFELMYAIPWLGAAMVPVNTRLATPEVQYVLEDSGACVLFVDGAMKVHTDALAGQMPTVKAVVYLDDDASPVGMRPYEELAAAPAIEDAGAGGDTLAALFYTGGTTGKSKGVMLSHNNLVWNAMNVIAGAHYDEETTWLHSAADVPSRRRRGDIRRDDQRWAPRLRAALRSRRLLSHAQEKVTHTCLPTMLNMLANHPGAGDYDLSSLKCIFYGASPMPEGVLRKALQVFPNCQFVHCYGMTEAAPLLTLLPARYTTLDGPYAGRLKSCGQAAHTAEVKIVDENRQEVPPGTVGEVAAKGPMIMLGYWNKPEATAAVLQDGWYYSGDGAYMDDEGFVFVVDRLKDMIISGGENIYSADVENAISLMPGVAEVAVIGIPDAKWGEAIHAIIVPGAGADLTAEAVIAHCRTQIAGYKCPRSVEFRDTPLPLSGAAKVLKRELREPFWKSAKATAP